MTPLSSDDLLASFDAIDLPHVSLPESLADVAWADLDFFAWRLPEQPLRTFMCVPLRERNIGMIFETTPVSPGSHGLCDLCLTSDVVHGTVMATTQSWSNPRAKLGIFVCAHFDCSEAVRGARAAGSMGETISVGRRVERLQENVEKFTRRVTNLARR